MLQCGNKATTYAKAALPPELEQICLSMALGRVSACCSQTTPLLPLALMVSHGVSYAEPLASEKLAPRLMTSAVSWLVAAGGSLDIDPLVLHGSTIADPSFNRANYARPWRLEKISSLDRLYIMGPSCQTPDKHQFTLSSRSSCVHDSRCWGKPEPQGLRQLSVSTRPGHDTIVACTSSNLERCPDTESPSLQFTAMLEYRHRLGRPCTASILALAMGELLGEAQGAAYQSPPPRPAKRLRCGHDIGNPPRSTLTATTQHDKTRCQTPHRPMVEADRWRTRSSAKVAGVKRKLEHHKR